LQGSGRGLILRCYHNIRLEGLRKIIKTLSQDNRYPGQDLNPKIEAGVLTTRPRRSVYYAEEQASLGKESYDLFIEFFP
jgi:hypothetical protein